MSTYKLHVIFQVTSFDGEVSNKTFEETGNFRSVKEAEQALEQQLSIYLAEFSTQSLEWMVLEKCVILIKPHTSDSAVMLL